jgi:hypothetical protein
VLPGLQPPATNRVLAGTSGAVPHTPHYEMHAHKDVVADAFSDFNLDALSAGAVPLPAEGHPSLAIPATPHSRILTPDDVPKLSLKELHDELARLHVNTTGCLEKTDFQQRLIQALNHRRRSSSSLSSGSAGKDHPTSPSFPVSHPVVTADDVPKLSMKELHDELVRRHVDTTGCLEKSDYQQQLMRALSRPPSSRAPPVDAAKFESSAWDLEGFGVAKPPPPHTASPSLSPLQPSSLSSIAMSVMTVPLIPRTAIGAKIPFICVAPLLREVPLTYFTSCVTEKPLPQARPTASDRSHMPYTPAQSVGSRRLFELVLRPDVSTQDVLNAFAAAASTVHLDAVHSTSTSVLLQQVVNMPTPAFKAMVQRQRERIVPAVQPGASGLIDPVCVSPLAPLHDVDFGATKHAMSQYVNSLSVFVSVNPDGDRVALIMCGRFTPDPKREEFNGRAVTRLSPRDPVVVVEAHSVADAMNSLGLGASVGGILCSTPKLPSLNTRPTPGKPALIQSFVPSVSDIPAWITLRVSFLALQGTTTPAGQFHTFPLDDVEDDVVRIVGEMAARMRTTRCLAESMWSDAVELSKQRVQVTDGPALDILKFEGHGDCVAGLQRSVRKRMETELNSAVMPYETRAVRDEQLLIRAAAALESTYRALSVPMPGIPAIPDLELVPQRPPGYTEVASLTTPELIDVLTALDVSIDPAASAEALRDTARAVIVAKRQRDRDVEDAAVYVVVCVHLVLAALYSPRDMRIACLWWHLCDCF